MPQGSTSIRHGVVLSGLCGHDVFLEMYERGHLTGQALVENAALPTAPHHAEAARADVADDPGVHRRRGARTGCFRWFGNHAARGQRPRTKSYRYRAQRALLRGSGEAYGSGSPTDSARIFKIKMVTKLSRP